MNKDVYKYRDQLRKKLDAVEHTIRLMEQEVGIVPSNVTPNKRRSKEDLLQVDNTVFETAKRINGNITFQTIHDHNPTLDIRDIKGSLNRLWEEAGKLERVFVGKGRSAHIYKVKT